MSKAVTSQNLAVVLSDVHIGTNVNTNWYQQKYHEPYLVAALGWVVKNAASIRHLVLLGDLVDFWTYVPSATPPSMSDIIAANPNVLGANGALARAVEALAANQGQVWLTPGNHDINLTSNDAATLSAAVGGTITWSGGQDFSLQGQSGKRTTFAHGHSFTMFNAPYPGTNLSPLPIGHFVTRVIAWKVVNKLLGPGQTVADLHLWGQPSPDWSTIVSAVVHGENVAGVFLDLFTYDAGLSDSTTVVLPGGQSTTIAAAKTTYASLLETWLKWWPLEDVVRAAMADYTGGSWLAWFAQWLALKEHADLVVMGHTHQPVGGLTASPVAYVNNGYECAAIPDMNSGAAAFTFTVVDLEAGTAAMHKVAPDGKGGYAISDFSAPLFPVVEPPLLDFSCYVRITSEVGESLTRDPLSPPGHGRWVIPPPSTISDGESTWIWLQDVLGGPGTLGTVSYDGQLRYDFACPIGIADNVAGGPGADFVARSGADPWQPKGTVPKRGHPLEVHFTLTKADTSPNFTGKCGQNSFATSALGLQPGCSLELNGSTDLSGCIQANDGGCVYGVTLSKGSYEGLYQYRLSIDGRGPKGLGSGSMYLAFTDQTGDVYKKSFFSSTRHTLTLDYNSDSPAIVKVQWSNTAI
jgi:UDP-2,3-diacylglucosamine pyrophosphatase LpxH